MLTRRRVSTSMNVVTTTVAAIHELFATTSMAPMRVAAARLVLLGEVRFAVLVR